MIVPLSVTLSMRRRRAWQALARSAKPIRLFKTTDSNSDLRSTYDRILYDSSSAISLKMHELVENPLVKNTL